MSDVPTKVLECLKQLSLIPSSVQNPNFTPDMLEYHEPLSIESSGGTAMGTWSHEGVEWEVRLIGQISSHQTFLDDYGDMVFHKNRKTATSEYTSTDVGRAKWKISLAVPHASGEEGHQQILRRQFENLQRIETANFQAGRAGSILKNSAFAFKSDTQWRASALSGNIYQTFDIAPAGYRPASEYDNRGIIKRLPDYAREGLYVMPLNMVEIDAQPVDRTKILDRFRPGTWAELLCTLRVWSTFRTAPDALGEGVVTHVRRSYQLHLEGAQRLGDGRIKEGPLRVQPMKRPEKRKFDALL